MKKKFDSSRNLEIHPDEIFLDSKNLPDFDTDQFEGRIEKPISKKPYIFLCLIFLSIGLAYIARIGILQIRDGEAYSLQSENNRLRHSLIFAERGVIYDRNGELLASNVEDPLGRPFSARKYSSLSGLSHILGYMKYPAKDANGFYYDETYDGKDGVEKFYNEYLTGVNGLKIIETNATGGAESENTIEPPQSGKSLNLSVDAKLQNAFYEIIKKIVDDIGFTGGAAALMDIKTGEIIALTSFPEYSSQILTDGSDSSAIQDVLSDPRNPFLDRIVDGLYTPGSIVKPFIALGALQEDVINPETKILSTGSISLPNIYDPTKSTVFKDWKAHGYVNMREAISVSSDVYFYEVGGGFQNQKGLGISRIVKYMKQFGFGAKIPSKFFSGSEGVVPDPAWKKLHFDGEEWSVGDTYHTAIGQYGFQITPLQEMLAVAAIANDGVMVYPTIVKGESETPPRELPIAKQYFTVVQEGMRLSAVSGTASALNISSVQIAAKTGTAELGTLKHYVNSWVTGFFPYEKPKYAFVVIMEKGPTGNPVGASAVARQFFDWVAVHAPEYLR
ncbi:MAG: penicillin-binding transpeptidase domain-containing protein [Candidatus Taylorbacteria bacterium]